jgi:16S rRNA A1518/A1519 N6-dimethyltransferase RsmA/KsgA/DIM1 with predicted DNA glycosylase/AP lyase activity
VVRLTVAPRFAALQVEPSDFLRFVKTAFAQKRKTLLNNLKSGHPEAAVKAALKQAAARPDARAEMLSLEQLALVFRSL